MRFDKLSRPWSIAGMGDEPKRQYLRHALDAKIDVIEGSLGVKIRFETSNVSQGGVFIESDLLYDEGEIIWFSFTLPGAIEIRTRGRVVWAKQEVSNSHAFTPIANPQTPLIVAPAVGFGFIKGILDDVPYRFPLTPVLAPG